MILKIAVAFIKDTGFWVMSRSNEDFSVKTHKWYMSSSGDGEWWEKGAKNWWGSKKNYP